MGESGLQDALIEELRAILDWLFADQPVYLARNLNIYTRRRARQYPLAPDLAVFQGVTITPNQQDDLSSWRMYEPDRPAPTFVIEVAAPRTWRVDLQRKPGRYALMGVREYCVYDPKRVPVVPGDRLRLWRREERRFVVVSPAPDGRVWSTTLDSWLVPDGTSLYLTDRDGVRRLTRAEAERSGRIAALRCAAAEFAAKEAERAAKERAWAKLRELGIDPETLGEDT
jgi:hypothetical protein